MDARDRIPEELLRETDALRRVARGILFEPALAEDAVQEAWLAALRSQKREAHSGGWLTEAVRRIALGLRRQEARRTTRERGGARHEAQPSASDSAARVELLRELLDALEALEEPYRSAVQLRLLDDLPPRAIAAKLGVPVETARTRVKRGIAELRARLDARNAHRRGEFLAALAGSKTLGIALMTAQAKLSTAALIVLLAGALLWHPWTAALPQHDGPAPKIAADISTPSAPAAQPASPASAEPAVLEQGPAKDARARVAGGAEARWIVRGKARRGKSEPFPGAKVRVDLVAGYEGPGETLAQQDVQADASGDFALALPTPDIAVRVRATGNVPDYLCFQSEALVLRGAEAPTQLVASFYALDVTVRGHVRDPQGMPLRGAHVRSHMAPVDTDADGRFELRVCSALKNVTLYSWAEGFAEAKASLLVPEPGVVEGVEITLGASSVLNGRVQDENGNGIANAVLKGFPGGHAEAQTDRAGRFALSGLPTNERYLSLSATAEGFATLRHDLEDGRIPAGELVLTLERGIDLSGQVIDEEGKELPGAELAAGSSQFDVDVVRTVAGDAGRFRFASLQRKTRGLTVSAAGYAPAQLALALPEVGPQAPLQIVLGHGFSVRGIAVDEQGAPLSGIEVYVHHNHDYVENVHARTASDGRFSIAHLPGGRALTLELTGAGLVRAEQAFEPEQPGEQRVVLKRAAGLAGRVVDAASRKPVTAFRIRFVRGKLLENERPLSGYSSTWGDEGHEIRDADGRWDTSDEELNAGEVTGLEVSAAGYGPAIVEHAVTRLDPAREPILVELGSGACVRGRVVDSKSGAPIAGASLRRMRGSEEPGQWEGFDPQSDLTTVSDANGNFAFEGLPLEPLSLAVEAAGFAPRLDGPFDPDAHGMRTIELAPGATLRGVLRDGAGKALAHERILVSGGGGELRKLYRTWRLETDDEGRFELRDLMPASYGASRELRFEFGGVCDLTENVQISEARVYEVELRPRGAAHVRGTLHTTGRPAALLTVTALRAGGNGRAAIARDGRFELDGLEAGHWNFYVYEPGSPSTSRTGSAEVDVAATGETQVTIELLER